jgi:hypothetical protein
MNLAVKILAALGSAVLYYVLLRYVAPSQDPYFILGIGLIAWVSWLFGTTYGLITGAFLVPVTLFIYGHFEVATSYTSFASSPAYIAVEVIAAVSIGRFRITSMASSRKETDLEEANTNLQAALAQVQELGGIHSLCTSCKKIKSDDHQWMKIDAYLKEKTKAEFSHGICPDCAESYKTTPNTTTST